MGITIGPADWWVSTPDGIDGLAISCPVGTILPDCSALICRAGGVAWIVAPETTQVGEPWGNVTACGCIDNLPTGCSVHSDITSENFPCLYNRLISCGFNPCDGWFVPCLQLLQNPGYVCRNNWDPSTTFAYWSSTELNATCACLVDYSSCTPCIRNKGNGWYVRAFRCVTY